MELLPQYGNFKINYTDCCSGLWGIARNVFLKSQETVSIYNLVLSLNTTNYESWLTGNIIRKLLESVGLVIPISEAF